MKPSSVYEDARLTFFAYDPTLHLATSFNNMRSGEATHNTEDIHETDEVLSFSGNSFSQESDHEGVQKV